MGSSFGVSAETSKSFELNSSMVRLTDKAREYMQRVSNGGYITLGVKGGGCSGLTYTLSLDTEPRPDDKIIEDRGVRIFVDRKSYVFLAGTVLEYSDGLNGKGFEFHNPQAKTTCGCGTSFSV